MWRKTGGHCGRCCSFSCTHTLPRLLLTFFFFFFFACSPPDLSSLGAATDLPIPLACFSLWSELFLFRTCQPVNLVWVDYRKLTSSPLSFPPSPPPHLHPAPELHVLLSFFPTQSIPFFRFSSILHYPLFKLLPNLLMVEKDKFFSPKV